MSEWHERKLGEALNVHHGWAFKGEFFSEAGEMIVLSPGNFNEKGGFKPKSGAEKYYSGTFPEKFLLRAGSVVVAMTEQAHGLLGSSATIPASDRYLHNQRIGRLEVTDPDALDLRFAYHLMNIPQIRRQIQATSTGSKVRHTAPERIQEVVAALPSLPTQRAIVNVLDSIDDLIENNRRRAEVLEEMARVIYREWFVKFHYPGHEDVPLTASPLGPIPQSWAAKHLGDVATLVGGSTTTKAAYVDTGYVAYSAAGPDGFLPEFDVDGDGVVLSAVGARCGRTFWASGRWSSIANTIKVLPLSPQSTATWLFLATENPTMWPKRGSAQPFISINDARGVGIVVADEPTHNRFEAIAQPLFQQADVLRTKNERLAQMRDLLLPKLMTGQIDVSALDFDEFVEGAVAP